MPAAAERTTISRLTRAGRGAVSKKVPPNRLVEQRWWADGSEIVVGVDEVGRGAWAGPLMVGAAVIPRTKRITNVRDSKMLSEPERERLFPKVAAWCETWAVGAVSQAECDELGMSAAQKLAAARAIEGLGVRPDVVLIDGTWDFTNGSGRWHVERLVKGDARCLSISAASVLAKVTRDRHMREEAEHYPLWAFDSNKGYPCPVHKAALAHIGPSGIHRRTWIFMDHLPWPGLRVVRPEQPTLF